MSTINPSFDSKKLESFFKAAEEIHHKDVPEGERKKSFIDLGARGEILKTLIKMKNGCKTTISLALDVEDNSNAYYDFRILSAQEEADIHDEMKALKYEKFDFQYEVYLASKYLSRASSPLENPSQKALPEEILRGAFPKWLLIALGSRYIDFKNKYSPNLELLTDEMISEILEAVAACADDMGKLFIFKRLNSQVTPPLMLDLFKKLDAVRKQMDQFVIGS